MPAVDPATVAQAIRLRVAAHDKAVADLAFVQKQAADLAQQRAAALAAGRVGDVRRLDGQIAAADTSRSALTDAVRKAGDAWRDQLGQFLIDPCDASAAVPLLLLPVRIETRFANLAGLAGQATLNVRIYPDAVHLDKLRRTLTAEEQAAGDLYWTAQAGAADDAWKALTATVGDRRAGWVANQRNPDPSKRAAGPSAAERGAVARLLPDRFVVEVVQQGRTIRVTGAPIGPDPVMGLFGDQDDEKTLVMKNGLPVAPGGEWIVDFAEAQKIGLAVSVKLPLAAPVERVMVYGTRASRNEAQTAADLAALFEAHRYAADLAFVPVGTPTNNLDDQRAGYTPATAGAPAASSAAANGDGARLAAALGIAGSAFAGVKGADRTSDDAARAASIAFWWPTWGTVLDLINTNAKDVRFQVGDGELEQVRTFHRDLVRGRGPLPSLRIGKQPYGILPIGQVDALTFGDRVRRGIQKMALAARGQWRAALTQVPRLGQGDADKAMLEMLGTSPVSIGLRARMALTGHAIGAAGGANSSEQLEQVLNDLVWQQYVQASLTWPVGSLSNKANPVPLPCAHDSDGAALTTLAGGGSITEPKSVLQAFAMLSVQEARRRSAVSPISQLDAVAGKLANVAVAAGTTRPTSQAVAQAAAQGSDAVLALASSARDPAFATSTLASYQPEKVGQTSFATMAQASVNAEATREFALQALPEIVLAAGTLAQVKEALGRLAQADLSLDDRRILVGEALDIASHRLDAWLTALVESRRRGLRAKTAQGLQVGAFGWVENVKPATAAENKELGFIHAPSMAHAATAGVLRSAYLAHAREADGGGFAIDLSSRRARLAMDLLAARREGETLGQALGYRIERMMQDAGLGQFMMTMRARYPAKQGQLTDAGQPIDAATQELIAGTGLIDGVKFVDELKKKGVDFVAAQIEQKPVGDKYLEGVTWQPLGVRKPAFVAVADWTLKALDAAADLMMAEAVHQLTQGNSPRAAAALDAIKGDAPAPEPSVLGRLPTPLALTHRTLLVLGSGPGWAASLRASAAPELEAWAAARLGPAAKIVCGTGATGAPATLAQGGLSALDFLYEAGDRAGLAARLAAKLGLDPAAAIADAPQPGWPAGSRALGEALDLADLLRQVLIEARAATPADLAGPFQEPTRAPDIAAAVQRLAAARGTLDDRIATLSGGGLPGTTIPGTLASMAEFGIRAPEGAAPADALAIVLKEATRRRDAVNAALNQPAPGADDVAAAGEALFGAGFRLIVPLAPIAGTADGWAPAVAGAVAKPAALRRWLSDMGSVRPALGRLVDALMLAEAFGYAPALGLAQFVRPGAAPATAFAGDGPPGDVATASVLDLSGSVNPAGPVTALVIDDFVEPIADRGERTSGVAFNARAPGARPPQTMLLAVAPDDKRWTTDRLSATLADTIELAKLRGVTLERQLATPRLLPAIYAQSWSLQGEPVLNFAALAGTALPFEMWFVKDNP